MKGLSVISQRNTIFAVVSLAILFGVIFFLLQPCLFVDSEHRLITWFVVFPEHEAFSLQFVHSVERTPVLEKYRVDSQNNLVLYQTEYESFGVGLPFLASEGKFTAQNDRFILEMNRVFPTVALRTWPEGQLTLTANNKQHRLYQVLPSGSMVRLSAGTWLSRLQTFL